MNEYVTESYTEDGKELLELLQEWIDENNSFLYCFSRKKVIEYKCR